MRELNSIQERILDKTLYLIGKTESFNVPIRSIVKEADVNISAINYYFGSKEELLIRVKEFYIENTRAAYEVIDNIELSKEDRLIIATNEIMEYSFRYPGILIILKEAKKKRSISPLNEEILTITQEANSKLIKLLKDILSCKEDELEFKSTLFISSILHPVLNADIPGYKVPDLSNKTIRIEYIKTLIAQLKR